MLDTKQKLKECLRREKKILSFKQVSSRSVCGVGCKRSLCQNLAVSESIEVYRILLLSEGFKETHRLSFIQTSEESIRTETGD